MTSTRIVGGEPAETDSQDSITRHRGARLLKGVGVSGLIGILGLVVTVAVVPPPQPDINVAKSFISQYWETAPTAPQKTWKQMTQGLRDHPPNSSTPLTFPEYRSFFTQYSHIDVDHVGISRDYDGWYAATVTFFRPGAAPSVAHFEFQLQCPRRTRVLWPCTAKNVKMNADARYPRRFWDDQQ